MTPHNANRMDSLWSCAAFYRRDAAVSDGVCVAWCSFLMDAFPPYASISTSMVFVKKKC